jgi:outer membrane protein TolC
MVDLRCARRAAGATLAAWLLLPSIACRLDEHYDDEPEFVERLDALRTEAKRLGEEAAAGARTAPPTEAPAPLPEWYQQSDRPLLPQSPQPRPLTLDDLFVIALKHSTQIRVFSEMPLIRETGIREAEGAFDVHAFARAQYDHKNEPVGNALISTTRDRFVENEGSLEFGLRKKVVTGAELSLTQRLADKESNASYFVPGHQTSATLTLRLAQPLLAGGGVRYNSSVMYLARLDTDIAEQELRRQVEAHLLEIARTYWALYAARATYAQYRLQAQFVGGIVDELKARANADALRHQILRAESALSERRADLVRAELAILTGQERLRALVNEPEGWTNTEIVPTTPIHGRPFAPDPARPAGALALEQRPEVRQAFLQLRASAERIGMNRDDVLPRLDLILEGRFGGLDRSFGLGHALGDGRRFDEAGGLVGLMLDVPLGNDTAEARLMRREFELRQQFSQVRTTIDTVLLEVHISEREVEVGWRDMVGKSEAARAAREEVQHLVARKDLEAMRAPASPFILDLMEAQDRQIEAERALAQAVATYQVAVLNLQRAQGTLLEFTSIAPVRSVENGLPVIKLEKKPAP